MEPFSIEEAKKVSGARIVAVGVGGGGGNMIGHMIREGVSGIEMIMINTDAQALKDTKNATTIQIGAKLTKGSWCWYETRNWERVCYREL